MVMNIVMVMMVVYVVVMMMTGMTTVIETPLNNTDNDDGNDNSNGVASVDVCNNGITRMVIIDADDSDADWPRNKLIIYLIKTFLDPWAQQTDKMPPS